MVTMTGLVFLAAFLFLTPGLGLGADVLPRAERPEDVGLSTERLARLTKVTQDHVEAGRLPGAVILLARHGKIAYFESFGHRDRDKGLTMTRDALFRIYSMTKPITSVAVMMLHEEGHFQVSDPVSRYLELAKVSRPRGTDASRTFEAVDARRQITIQDLLRHTRASLTAAGEGPVNRMYRDAKIGSRDDTNAELVTKLGELPLLHQPGTRFEYGVSTDVLGGSSKVSGKSLGQFFEERIFRLSACKTPASLSHRTISRAPRSHGRARAARR
jgi:CubicO group peptidase (beta-lactamase class C family)